MRVDTPCLDAELLDELCRDLDDHLEQFRSRPLEGAYPYLWLDAKHLKVRDRGRVVCKALVVAYAVHDSGRREDRLGPRRGPGRAPCRSLSR